MGKLTMRDLLGYGKKGGIVIALMAVSMVLTIVSAVNADSLYVSDTSDNSVKQYDALTGAFKGSFVKSKAGIHGARGLVFDSNRNLIISDQNVGTSTNGDILQFDPDGKLLNRIVSNNDKNAPVTPRGIVLVDGSLFVADFTTSPNANKAPTPGRLLKYKLTGEFVGAFSPPTDPTGVLVFHPRGVVVGPDGLLYVSSFSDLVTGLGGQVFRFHTDGTYKDMFINSTGGVGELNRPEGLVFGPDGKLYITSFAKIPPVADPTPIDTDKIFIFQGPLNANPGTYADHIDLDTAGPNQPRAFAQALLFGPGGYLFVPISGNGPETGTIRRYDVTTKTDLHFPLGAPLGLPWYLTFGNTSPSTLAY